MRCLYYTCIFFMINYLKKMKLNRSTGFEKKRRIFLIQRMEDKKFYYLFKGNDEMDVINVLYE